MLECVIRARVRVVIYRVWGAGCPNVPNVRVLSVQRSTRLDSTRSSVARCATAAPRVARRPATTAVGEGVRVTRRVARDGARDGDRVRHRERALRVRGLVSQERAVRRDPGLDFPARRVHVCDDVRGDEFDVDVDVV